jgi:hypothetical protein
MTFSYIYDEWQIENEKTRQMEESAAFDTQLEAVCEQLKSDWKFYAKENLCVLLADKVRAAQEVERKSKEVNDEVVEASRRLEKLKFDYGNKFFLPLNFCCTFSLLKLNYVMLRMRNSALSVFILRCPCQIV